MASAASPVLSAPPLHESEGTRLARWAFFSLLAVVIPMRARTGARLLRRPHSRRSASSSQNAC